MKKLFIFTTILVIILGVVFVFYKKSQTQSNTDVAPSLKSLFFSDKANTEQGGGLGSNISKTINNIFNNQVDQSEKPSQFKQITTYPVAGLTVFDLITNKTLPVDPKTPKAKLVVETSAKKVLRYVSRRNGYIYEVQEGTTPLQITNISIPNIYETIFTNSNNNVLLRFLRDDGITIATYNVPIPKENPDGTRSQMNGSFLPDNIDSITSSFDGGKIAYLIPNISGSSITTSDYANIKKTLLLDSTFKDWSLSWPTEKKVFFQTKSSFETSGFLYYIDTTEKKLRKVLGNIEGLTTSISPSSNYIIYSESSGDGFTTKLFNAKNNSAVDLNLSILPEKCVWLKNENLICAGSESSLGSYPDDWYKGVVTFKDKIYLINTSDSTTRVLYKGEDEGFDIVSPQVDEVGRFLYFINKPTGDLWRFKY